MQNPETGRLEPITKERSEVEGAAGKPVFHVGEIVQVNGGWFRIRKITRKDLVLRGIPAPEIGGGDGNER